MSPTIHTAVIKGPDFRRDELFAEGDKQMNDIVTIFNTFAHHKITEINKTNARIVGVALFWTTRKHDDGFFVSRLDCALAWTNRGQPGGDPPLALYEIEVEKTLAKSWQDMNNRFE